MLFKATTCEDTMQLLYVHTWMKVCPWKNDVYEDHKCSISSSCLCPSCVSSVEPSYREPSDSLPWRYLMAS